MDQLLPFPAVVYKMIVRLLPIEDICVWLENANTDFALQTSIIQCFPTTYYPCADMKIVLAKNGNINAMRYFGSMENENYYEWSKYCFFAHHTTLEYLFQQMQKNVHSSNETMINNAIRNGCALEYLSQQMQKNVHSSNETMINNAIRNGCVAQYSMSPENLQMIAKYISLDSATQRDLFGIACCTRNKVMLNYQLNVLKWTLRLRDTFWMSEEIWPIIEPHFQNKHIQIESIDMDTILAMTRFELQHMRNYMPARETFENGRSFADCFEAANIDAAAFFWDGRVTEIDQIETAFKAAFDVALHLHARMEQVRVGRCSEYYLIVIDSVCEYVTYANEDNGFRGVLYDILSFKTNFYAKDSLRLFQTALQTNFFHFARWMWPVARQNVDDVFVNDCVLQYLLQDNWDLESIQFLFELSPCILINSIHHIAKRACDIPKVWEFLCENNMLTTEQCWHFASKYWNENTPKSCLISALDYFRSNPERLLSLVHVKQNRKMIHFVVKHLQSQTKCSD